MGASTIHTSFQLCSLWNVEQLINFEDEVQSLPLNMCLYDVCSLILTKTTHQAPTNQIERSY